MEILFVLLVIALVMSFALPIFRTVRYDIKNARAQAALKKLAEARRSYYQASKGSDVIPGFFVGADAKNIMQTFTCDNVIASGVPGTSTSVNINQLLACGYLNWRDFADLPYKFYVCNTGQWASEGPCRGYAGTSMEAEGPVYVGAVGTEEAGPKYKYDSAAADPYRMFMLRDMVVKDNAK